MRTLDFLFVLPGKSYKPIGGYKVVFEYANSLSKMNYSVGILYSDELNKNISLKTVKSYLRYIILTLLNIRKKFWYDLDENIEIYHQFTFNEKTLPKSVNIFATAWNTAYMIASMVDQTVRRYYLIQGYEVWSASENAIIESYGLGLTNIAISKWLKSIVEKSGNNCLYLPNGLDHKSYYINRSIESRENAQIITLYHPDKNKGYFDVLEVCKRLKLLRPDLKLIVFGAYTEPKDFPEWASYFYLPSAKTLCDLYNSASIFISASRSEGWGLTACEAMQCGCSVCLTNISGYQEFAINEINSLVSPIGDFSAMVDNVIRLINNSNYRYQLALQGHYDVQKYSWIASTKSLIDMIEGNYEKSK